MNIVAGGEDRFSPWDRSHFSTEILRASILRFAKTHAATNFSTVPRYHRNIYLLFPRTPCAFARARARDGQRSVSQLTETVVISIGWILCRQVSATVADKLRVSGVPNEFYNYTSKGI